MFLLCGKTLEIDWLLSRGYRMMGAEPSPQGVVRLGPPFSIPAGEVRGQFSGRSPALLSRQALPGGLKGKCPPEEVT